MPIDYKKYPKNWKTEIRPRILERANNCCEFCKVPNHSLIIRGFINNHPIWQNMDGQIFSAVDGRHMGDCYLGDFDKPNNGTKVILTIAHLDHDKENHNVSDDRLKALCQRCHLSYDMDTHKKKRRETLNKQKGLNDLFG